MDSHNRNIVDAAHIRKRDIQEHLRTHTGSILGHTQGDRSISGRTQGDRIIYGIVRE